MVNTNAGKAIRSLWDDTCTVSGKESVTNKKTKRTEQIDGVLYSDVPCRLSIKQLSSTSDFGHAASVGQSVKLFLAPDIVIPAGSRISVTHKGIVTDYKQSGQGMVYTHHQEILLELAQERA